MTKEEIKVYALQERIKAYIYMGVEAEMDLIEANTSLAHADEDDKEYYRRRAETHQNKIKRANERIDDLVVALEVQTA